MEKIVNIFQQEKQLHQILENSRAFRQIEKDWSQIVGKLAPELKPVYIKAKVLHVETANFIWVNEVAYYKADILKRLNKILKGCVIKDLKISFNPQVTKMAVEVQSLVPAPAQKTLETLVQDEIERKKAAGYHNCPQCQLVYTQDVICIFCQNASA